MKVVRRGGLAALLTVLTISWALPCPSAKEPDGNVAFRFEWVSAEFPSATSRVLRLSLTPWVELKGAALRLRAPDGIALELVDLRLGSVRGDLGQRWSPSAPGDVFLGDVATRSPVLLEFRVEVAPGIRGGIASVNVSGEGPSGKSVAEAFGIPMGGNPSGEVRFEAREYPAARAE